MRLLLCLIIALVSQSAFAQQDVKTFFYRLSFKDKANSSYSINRPEEFLSRRSIERRSRQELPLTESDLPVSTAYLDSLRKLNVTVHFTSRWLNAATVETEDSLFFQKAAQLPFVDDMEPIVLVNIMDTLATTIQMGDYVRNDYGDSYNQISMLKGDALHNMDLRGQGKQIALLDGGYFKVDTLRAFRYLRRRNGILNTWDFYEKNEKVYEDNRHGMNVLSIMAGFVPGSLLGTAPEADYYLLKTENTSYENLVEEDAWVAGLEWADSAGADVVNSSLGYTQFNHDFMNHTYPELDGETAFASRAASMAASKGMIVVNSAGNSGNKPWYYISVPADAKNILAVGAVEADGTMGYLSSRGPAADGRVKPDVCAQGVATVGAGTSDGDFWRINGTSAAAPIISGLTACLWQAYPDATSYEIMDAIRKSASHYYAPNDSFGYGIPNFLLAKEMLEAQKAGKDHYLVSAYPNPFDEHLTLTFYTKTSFKAVISLYDIAGRLLLEAEVPTEERSINSVPLGVNRQWTGGIYIITIQTPDGLLNTKVFRSRP